MALAGTFHHRLEVVQDGAAPLRFGPVEVVVRSVLGRVWLPLVLRR